MKNNTCEFTIGIKQERLLLLLLSLLTTRSNYCLTKYYVYEKDYPFSHGARSRISIGVAATEKRNGSVICRCS